MVKDLTGRGNDLTVRRLHSSGAEALTWSPEHHRGQPAHASLRFDGGQGPDRGAVLTTADGAALNSEKFPRGYTIETFVRLPEPFEGNHDWMGILSWEGRNGDAGKTTGWSPLEPTCSLNLSPSGSSSSWSTRTARTPTPPPGAMRCRSGAGCTSPSSTTAAAR